MFVSYVNVCNYVYICVWAGGRQYNKRIKLKAF